MSESEISWVKRSKAQAKASYNRISSFYDLFSSFERKYAQIGINMLDIQRGEKILEIGFGTGHALLTLCKLVGNTGKVYGIDISEGMYNISKRRIMKEGFSNRVRLVCGDAATLPFPAKAFDAVFMSFTLELFDTPEIPVVLNECKRVLRDEGRICIVAMSKKGKTSMVTRLYEWFHELFPSLVDCRPIYVVKSLTQVGFKILTSMDLSLWGLRGEAVLARKSS
ncbi:MAG: class I SAM-dependent methyltransferase [Promethearchaeota archaeon]